MKKVDAKYFAPRITRMHFTLFVPWLVKGGADRCGLDVIQAVKEQYPDATVETVICRTNRAGNVWKGKFEKFGRVIDLSQHWHNNNICQAILDYLRMTRPSHIMVNNAHDIYNMLPSVRKACPNSFISCLLHMELPGAWNFPSDVIEHHECIDKVFTVSRKLSDKLALKGVPVSKLVPLHWFGYRETPSLRDITTQEIRRRIGIDDAKCQIILFPFRISHQKRPELIIPIMGYLQKHMNCCGVVAGSGEKEHLVRSAAEKAGLNIRWLGPVDPDDMHHLYRVAFCSVTPSLDEGIPLTYFEAMQVGCPVVATNVGAVDEILTKSTGVPITYSEDLKEQAQKFAASILALNARPKAREAIIKVAKENIRLNENYDIWRTTLMNHVLPNVVSFGVNPPHIPPKQEKVFVIGAPKTGTSSVGAALERLGYHDYKWNPVMQDYYHFSNYPPIWEKVGQFDSFSDGPFNTGDFYKKLFDRYPTAKFVLTTRDKELWKESFKHHFGPQTPNELVNHRYRLHKIVDEDWWTWYDRRNAEIVNFFLQRNSGNRLLQLKIGKDTPETLWLRLCQFLGTPLPMDISYFPHENKDPNK